MVTNNPSLPIKDQYFLALGEFVHKFAEVELVLNYVVRGYLKIEEEKYIAVFSALRADTASDHLRKIIAAEPESTKGDAMLYLLDQISLFETSETGSYILAPPPP